ncbi:MAG: amidohydrolase [Fretibacterium sp.]|nr:amidohydrolase [Fretibacterium sp.]
MDIKTLAEKYEPYIIERRRHYHACPELSGQEKGTRAQIKKDLEALGIADIHEMEGCYGLFADIQGGGSGRTVALRTDIDALEIAEKTGLPFASANGSMHACGHDNHIAMLLGAARILNEVKEELCGRVRLVVQPAEEIATGARAMVNEGAMDGVDAIYGAHIWGTLDAPLIDVTPGSRMACCDRFSIEVEGATSHGSAPHLGVDAVTVSAAIVNNLQQCVSRMNDPLNPLVLTVGTIHGGSRWNSVSGHVSMEGTVRTFEKDLTAAKVMRQVVERTAETFNAKAAFDYKRLTPPVINENERLVRVAHDAVVKLYGEEGIGHLPTMMASEDFSWFGEKAPYVFAFVGSRNKAKGLTYTNHNEHYDVDEDVLKRGAAVMAQFAVDFLREQ